MYTNKIPCEHKIHYEFDKLIKNVCFERTNMIYYIVYTISTCYNDISLIDSEYRRKKNYSVRKTFPSLVFTLYTSKPITSSSTINHNTAVFTLKHRNIRDLSVNTANTQYILLPKKYIFTERTATS